MLKFTEVDKKVPCCSNSAAELRLLCSRRIFTARAACIDGNFDYDGDANSFLQALLHLLLGARTELHQASVPRLVAGPLGHPSEEPAATALAAADLAAADRQGREPVAAVWAAVGRRVPSEMIRL